MDKIEIAAIAANQEIGRLREALEEYGKCRAIWGGARHRNKAP